MSYNIFEMNKSLDIDPKLIDAIRGFPIEQPVEHCGVRSMASTLEGYWTCPKCGVQIKLRSFAACTEIQDLFDAFAEWLSIPGAEAMIKKHGDQLLRNRAD